MSDDLLWNLLAGETGHSDSASAPGSSSPQSPQSPQSSQSSKSPMSGRTLISWHPLQLIALVVFGVCLDAIVRSDRVGVGTSIALTITGVGVLLHRAGRSKARVGLVSAATVLAWCLTLRSSAWLGIPTLFAAGGLLALAVNTGSTLTTDRLRDVVRSAFRVLVGPAALWVDLRGRVHPSIGAIKRHARFTKGALRGVVLAVPVLAMLGGLLASGDKVFARVFSFNVPGLGPALSHIVLFVVGAITLAVVFAAASMSSVQRSRVDDRSRIGVIEAMVVLGSVSALYIVFAAVQVVAIAGGDDHIRRTTGLTYAEYARSGFFQLLAVSVLTLVVLGLTRYGVGTALRLRRSIVIASEAVVLLTLGIVGVAFRRMSLYENAYGLTMRRLLPHIVIAVLGIVFALLGVAYANDLRATARGGSEGSEASHRTARTWVIPASLSAVVVALIGMNVVNLEAIVARSQLERSRSGESSATAEILGLGPDAVPTVVSWLRAHPLSRPGDAPVGVDAVLRWACPGRSSAAGWAAFTWSSQRADDARRSCPSVK